jgi:hypothetical protein
MSVTQSKEKFPDRDPDTRMPVPPPKSCDCRFHVHDDIGKYPPK